LNESEETTLICRCQKGDQDAFRLLIERYNRVLFGTAYLMTRDRQQAEDAVQDALIQVWKHLPSLRLRGSFEAWLIRILINEVNKKYRKKRLPTIPLDQAIEIGDCLDDPGEAAILHEEQLNLRKALQILPPEQREVVVLRYFSDLSVPEIATVTGQREGTVKSRLSRAVVRLGEFMRSQRKNEMEKIK
jgi:RNA polymerase sigma-70 factor, ECF subfamily